MYSRFETLIDSAKKKICTPLTLEILPNMEECEEMRKIRIENELKCKIEDSIMYTKKKVDEDGKPYD